MYVINILLARLLANRTNILVRMRKYSMKVEIRRNKYFYDKRERTSKLKFMVKCCAIKRSKIRYIFIIATLQN